MQVQVQVLNQIMIRYKEAHLFCRTVFSSTAAAGDGSAAPTVMEWTKKKKKKKNIPKCMESVTSVEK